MLEVNVLIVSIGVAAMVDNITKVVLVDVVAEVGKLLAEFLVMLAGAVAVVEMELDVLESEVE